MSKALELTGKRYGKLNVLQRVENGKDGRSKWLCQCDCGNTSVVIGKNLKTGMSTSCGCNHLNKQFITHNKSNTRLYSIWSNMKSRCLNSKNSAYHNYGLRGINICDEWIVDFESFYQWSIQNGYSNNLTLDRKNNDLGYNPANCRWTDYKTQANNTRTNHKVTIDGKVYTLSQLSDFTGIRQCTLWQRLKNIGGRDIKDLIRPLRRKRV